MLAFIYPATHLDIIARRYIFLPGVTWVLQVLYSLHILYVLLQDFLIILDKFVYLI